MHRRRLCYFVMLTCLGAVTVTQAHAVVRSDFILFRRNARSAEQPSSHFQKKTIRENQIFWSVKEKILGENETHVEIEKLTLIQRNNDSKPKKNGIDLLDNSATNGSMVARTCKYRQLVHAGSRFVLVSVVGTSVATLGVFNNVLLVFILVTKCDSRASHLFFLTWLAVFDILVALSYIGLFSIEKMWAFTENVWLSEFWHRYAPYLSAIGQTAMTSAVYMMMAASFERYSLVASWTGGSFSLKTRFGIFAFAVLIAMVVKGSTVFEVTLFTRRCSGLGRLVLFQTPVSAAYRKYWQIWTRHVLSVFLPFVTLLWLNITIVRSEKATMAFRGAMMRIAIGYAATRERQSRIREASRMLAASVSMYFLTNSLNFFVTMWEEVSMGTLRAFLNGAFYAHTADAISFLTMSCGTLRLPLYYLCNKQLRHIVRDLLYQLINVFNPFDDCGPISAKQRDMSTAALPAPVRHTLERQSRKRMVDHSIVANGECKHDDNEITESAEYSGSLGPKSSYSWSRTSSQRLYVGMKRLKNELNYEKHKQSIDPTEEKFLRVHKPMRISESTLLVIYEI